METWELGYEDNENEMAPDVDDAEDNSVDNDMDVELGRARWTNVERLVADPRASEGSYPKTFLRSCSSRISGVNLG